MSETEHHLENAEHAQHAAHDPFDRRVAVTIAIVAALLACVTLLSHRAHNETLQLQIEANDNLTLASNQWNYYQAKKNRQYLYEADTDLVRMLVKEPRAEVTERLKDWEDKVKKYKSDSDAIQEEAKEYDEKAKELRKDSEHRHHLGDRYDLAELAVEFAVVLCSVAILTKRKAFWQGGIAFALVGLGVAISSILNQYLWH
jgi:hypothetical protein